MHKRRLVTGCGSGPSRLRYGLFGRQHGCKPDKQNAEGTIDPTSRGFSSFVEDSLPSDESRFADSPAYRSNCRNADLGHHQGETPCSAVALC